MPPPRRLIQIVPALPPPATGVGDYALRVAEKLLQDFGIETSFVSARDDLPRPSSEALLRLLEKIGHGSDTIALLHLSPYGFDKHGCPVWLARGLREWTAQGAGRALITMYHELDATGPPWTRTFWVSWLQRRVIREIHGVTRSAITSTAAFAERLHAWAAPDGAPVTRLAVPSNVGEPESVPPIAERRRRLAVFGIRAGADRLTHRATETLERIIRDFSIDEIAVIGAQPRTAVFDGLACTARAFRSCDAHEVSGLLCGSLMGLSWYPPRYLAKSGVFAAYCAHGVPTLVLDDPATDGGGDRDGLNDGWHYLASSGLSAGAPPDLQKISTCAREWYRGHGVRQHAELIAAECRRYDG